MQKGYLDSIPSIVIYKAFAHRCLLLLWNYSKVPVWFKVVSLEMFEVSFLCHITLFNKVFPGVFVSFSFADFLKAFFLSSYVLTFSLNSICCSSHFFA